jgi:hypothetical protein
MIRLFIFAKLDHMDDTHKLDEIYDIDYAYNIMLIPQINLKWWHFETKLNHMNETHHMDEIGAYWLNHFNLYGCKFPHAWKRWHGIIRLYGQNSWFICDIDYMYGTRSLNELMTIMNWITWVELNHMVQPHHRNESHDFKVIFLKNGWNQLHRWW